MMLYSDLAEWWQLVSPTSEYEEEAAFLATLLRCGGGNVAWWIKGEFELTLADLSPRMLAMSLAQNPECEHVVGDMRTLDLGREFDAVLIHDAIMYMTTLEDLRKALTTAKRHARRIVVAPDHLKENFRPSTDHGGEDGPERQIRYLEWTHDPDPDDTVVDCDYILVMKENGELRTVVDRHQVGLFPRQTWLDLLAEGGYSVAAIPDPTGEGIRLEVFLAWADSCEPSPRHP